MERVTNQNKGNAGEYYIAYKLSENNFVVSVTLGRNEGYDLIAVSPKGRKVLISVKASTNMTFHLGKKDEDIKDKDFYYAFVNLKKEFLEPEFWIIPSEIVSEIITKNHKKYENTLKKNGTKHKDTDMRNFVMLGNKYYTPGILEPLEKYHNNLDILQGDKDD